MAQSQEDIRAAEEATAKAEKDYADRQAEKKRVLEKKKELEEALARKE